MNYYLAIDIGASSGRCILGSIENQKLVLETIHRFENGVRQNNGHLCWDYNYLFSEIVKGLKECKKLDKCPKSLAIDTWGVDFVLLDKNNNVLGDHIAYRDKRTLGMDDLLRKYISEESLYQKTGIQKQLFNSIYQLMAIKQSHPEYIEQAASFLMVPEYLNFLLTGKIVNEYTNATTTQLVNSSTYTWDQDLLEIIGNKDMFNKIEEPGYSLGQLRPAIVEEIGFDTEVILVASHDTASAVLALPYEDSDSLYISSGTWSLMGTLVKEAITSVDSQKLNFTNSGGVNKEYLYLKNIMGLWLIQEVSREFNGKYSYVQWCEMAESSSIKSIIDCQDNRFISPKSMIKEIQDYCIETNQAVPINENEIAAVVYNSLAESYRKTKEEFETLSRKTINKIQIVGGGSQADYLNKVTSIKTGCTVSAGPIEGTAIGNIIVQLLAQKEINSMSESKVLIRNTFSINQYSGGKKHE